MSAHIGMRLGAGLAALTMLAGTPAATAAISGIDPSTLPRGHTPRVPVLEGNRIVTPQGTITLRKKLLFPMLMGPVGRSELVAGASGAGIRFYAVGRNGMPVERGPVYDIYDSLPMMAAGRIIVSYSDRGTGMSSMTQVDAATGHAVHRLARMVAQPLSISRRGVVYAQFNKVSLWKRDGHVAPLFTLHNIVDVPEYVDLGRNLVITDDLKKIAFRSVSKPNVVRWRMPEAKPLAITPDGRGILVQPVNPKTSEYGQVLQLRRLSDGAILRRYRFTGSLSYLRAQFESNAAFVLPVGVSGHRFVLVRCGVTGGCVRASGAVRSIELAERGTL